MPPAREIILCCLISAAALMPAATGEPTQPSAWVAMAPLPQPLLSPGLIGVGGKMFLIGGGVVRDGRAITFDETFVYDPVSRTWSATTPMPTKRSMFGVAHIGDRLLVIGGTPTDSTEAMAVVEAFDLRTRQWRRKAPMPTARSALAVATAGGKVFAIGGNRGREHVVEMYDPALDRWLARRPTIMARRTAAAVAVDGLIYAMGGCGQDGRTADATAEVYDPKTDRWTMLPAMPNGHCDVTAAALNGRIYVIGGWDKGPIDKVDAFDIKTGRWQAGAPLVRPRQFISATATANAIIIAGGAERLPDAVDRFEMLVENR